VSTAVLVALVQWRS